MTTEHCQHKPCLSEEAAELWLQQMLYRLWDDTGSVLNSSYTFCLLNSLVHEVTSSPALNNWNMTCMEQRCLYKLANWEPITSWANILAGTFSCPYKIPLLWHAEDLQREAFPLVEVPDSEAMDGWMGVEFCSVACYAAVITEVGEYSLSIWRKGYTSSALEFFYMGGWKECRGDLLYRGNLPSLPLQTFCCTSRHKNLVQASALMIKPLGKHRQLEMALPL